MMPDQVSLLLDRARRDTGLSHGALWLRYFAVGGTASTLELEAFLCGALEPTTHEYNLLAVALNERFVELGGNHPIPYSDD